MKLFISLLLFLVTNTASAQLQKYKREVDSLRLLYKKNVIGYSKNITINGEPRESLIIFYVDKGEMQDELVWTKLIDNSNTKIMLLRDLDELYPDSVVKDSVILQPPTPTPKPTYSYNGLPIYYNDKLVGFMNFGYFTKIQKVDYIKYSVPQEVRIFLENDILLDQWLRIKFGAYYKKTE